MVFQGAVVVVGRKGVFVYYFGFQRVGRELVAGKRRVRRLCPQVVDALPVEGGKFEVDFLFFHGGGQAVVWALGHSANGATGCFGQLLQVRPEVGFFTLMNFSAVATRFGRGSRMVWALSSSLGMGALP